MRTTKRLSSSLSAMKSERREGESKRAIVKSCCAFAIAETVSFCTTVAVSGGLTQGVQACANCIESALVTIGMRAH